MSEEPTKCDHEHGTGYSSDDTCDKSHHTGNAAVETAQLKHISEDVELMLSFQSGDEEAFVSLYHRYRNKIFNFCRRYLGDFSEAEEATQDVFLKLYRARASYLPSARLTTFLYKIASNHCANLAAKHERKYRDAGADPIEVANRTSSTKMAAEQILQLSQKELRGHLLSALSELPEAQRCAVLLTQYEGLSYAEAADTQELSIAALKSAVHRGKETLKRRLRPLQGFSSMEVPV